MKFSKVSSAIKMIAYGAGKVLTLILLVMAAVLLAGLLTFAPLGLLRDAMEHHWAWGFPIVALYCVGIYAIVRAFRTERLKMWEGIQTIVGGLMFTILIFAFLTFALNKFGAAHYQGFTRQSVDETWSITFNFIKFYLWQLFELIPGVKINEAFGWNSPLVKFGFVAGFLLIAFRVVIIFVLLQGFRDWWVKRATHSTLETNKALVQGWFDEVWNKGRAEAIDQMFAADGIAHGLSDDAGNPLKGPNDFKPFHESFRGAFPDIEVVVEDMIAEGDVVAARCSVRGKHTGDHLGTASNAPVQFTGITIARIRDGKIVEAWNNFDFLTMNKQIGAI